MCVPCIEDIKQAGMHVTSICFKGVYTVSEDGALVHVHAIVLNFMQRCIDFMGRGTTNRVNHIPAANRPCITVHIVGNFRGGYFTVTVLRKVWLTVFTNRSLPKAPHTHSAYSWLFYEGSFNTAVGSCGYFNLSH